VRGGGDRRGHAFSLSEHQQGGHSGIETRPRARADHYPRGYPANGVPSLMTGFRCSGDESASKASLTSSNLV